MLIYILATPGGMLSFYDRGDGLVFDPFFLFPQGQESKGEHQTWLETRTEAIAPWFEESEIMSGLVDTAPAEVVGSSVEVIVPESKKRRWKKAAKKTARLHDRKTKDKSLDHPATKSQRPELRPRDRQTPKEESARSGGSRKQEREDDSLVDSSAHKCRKRKKRRLERETQVTPVLPPRRHERPFTSLPASTTYRESRLRARDSLAYRAAGVIFSRRGHKGDLQFLLGKKMQKELWTVLGGKKEWADRDNSLETAFRELYEETAGLLGADTYRYLKEWASKEMVTFIADGKYVLYCIDCNDRDFEASHMEKLRVLPRDYLKKPAEELAQVAWLPYEWVKSRYHEMHNFLKVVFSTEVFVSQFNLRSIGGTYGDRQA